MGAKAKPLVSSMTDAPMGDDDEVRSLLANAYLAMDHAFCARMRRAIVTGLDSAPIGVITTPGTKTPKYVPPEPRPPASSSGHTNF
jgi:hypothetical protein